MIKSAKEYHDFTSYSRNMLKGHQLDWQNQPLLYKIYKGLVNIPLPEIHSPAKASIRSILTRKPDATCSAGTHISKVSTILRLAYCITAQADYSGGVFYYRNAASAGALYPVEIYLMVRNTEGLDDGLYHFNIMSHSLTRLRKGDFSVYAGGITFPVSESRPVISFILSSIFLRSSWKYRDRAYRYHLLDTGHVMENLILALKSMSTGYEINFNFDDEKLNMLIGVDRFREAGLVMVNIPGNESVPAESEASPDTLPDNITNASIVSGKDIDYPSIREIHEAGNLPSGRGLPEISPSPSSLHAERWEEIRSVHNLQTGISYPECLFTRRSKRNFIDEKIDYEDFMCILDSVSGASEDDAGSKGGPGLLQTLFFAERVKDIAPGLYSLDRPARRFGMLKPGSFGKIIAHTCLNQEWLKNTGLHFLFVCNMEEMDKIHGPRGYRYSMINAGRIGQLLYIAATSLGLGCCGIGAFYDDEAIELLGLKDGFRLLYLVAVGEIKA